MNEYDEEYFEFGLFMSRREYKTISRRLKRGRESSASEGKFVASIAPYGYKRVKIEGEKGYTLTPNPDEAKWIIKMFELRLSGMGTPVIANYLNDMKVPTRHGNLWGADVVNRMLMNPIYMGKIRRGYAQHIKTIKDGQVVEKVKHIKDIDECRIYDGLHEPLIDEETYYRAQEIRKELDVNPPVKKDNELKNPFAGLLFCAKCNKRIARTVMSGSRDKEVRVKCVNHRNCHNSGCKFELLEEKALEALRVWLDGYTVKLNTIGYSKEIKEHKMEIEQLDKELVKLKSQLNKAFEFVEQGIYSLEVFKERREKLEGDINTLSEQKEKREQAVYLLESDSATQINLIPKTQKLLEDYENLTVEERNNLLKEILVKIEYKKEGRGDIELDIYPRFSKFIV